MQLRPNPFRPDKPVDSFELFAGRSHELGVMIRALFNTGHGNARHMIVTGPRGIGKSSFINQIHSVTDNGDDVLAKLDLDAGDFRFRFPVFKCRARQGQSAEHIVTSLMDAMPTKLSAENVGNIVGDFVSKLKLSVSAPGINVEHPNESFTDLGREFVRTIRNLWLAIRHDSDGIIFIIDEIDTVAETSGIASFLKVTTEELVDAGLNQIGFYLVGVTGAMQKLMSDHPSIGRVFENVELRPMSHVESRDVIERTLGSLPSSRNIRVADESMQWVVEMASGFPAIIHTLCYEAFEHDTDLVLDKRDFDKAAVEVVTRIKRAELGALLRRAGAGRLQEILIAMADYDTPVVPVSFIAQKLELESNQFSSQMNTLKERNIIENTERGMYRYVEPMLRLYVQNLDVLEPELPLRLNDESVD